MFAAMRNIAVTALCFGTVYFAELARAADPVVDLAKQAAQEFDLLARSVESAAQGLIRETEQLDRSLRTGIALDWKSEPTGPQVFITRDGELLEFDSFSAYEVTATRRHFRYRFRGIDRAQRTGHRDWPFVADVRIQATEVRRQATVTRFEPRPIPNGWRPPTEKEQLNRAVALWLLPADSGKQEYVKHGYLNTLPVGPAVSRSERDRPLIVRGAISELEARLRRASPTVTQTEYRLTFHYSLKDLAWEPGRSVSNPDSKPVVTPKPATDSRR